MNRPQSNRYRQEVLEAVQTMGVKMHLIKTCSECGWEMEQIEIEANEENEMVWQCSECGRITGGV
jgi:ribosomal protein L37AE/L43A